MQICKYASMHINASMQVCTYTQVCKYAGMQASKYSSMHIYENMQVSMQVCTYMQICKYRSMQVRMYMQVCKYVSMYSLRQLPTWKTTLPQRWMTCCPYSPIQRCCCMSVVAAFFNQLPRSLQTFRKSV